MNDAGIIQALIDSRFHPSERSRPVPTCARVRVSSSWVPQPIASDLEDDAWLPSNGPCSFRLAFIHCCGIFRNNSHFVLSFFGELCAFNLHAHFFSSQYLTYATTRCVGFQRGLPACIFVCVSAKFSAARSFAEKTCCGEPQCVCLHVMISLSNFSRTDRKKLQGMLRASSTWVYAFLHLLVYLPSPSSIFATFRYLACKGIFASMHV